MCLDPLSSEVENRTDFQLWFSNTEHPLDTPQLLVGGINLVYRLVRIRDIPLKTVPLLIFLNFVVID